MKKIIAFVMLSLALVSCGKSDKKAEKATPETQKYVFKSVDMGDSYYLIIANQLNGRVFVGPNGADWYEATHVEPLKEYSTPSYAIEVLPANTPKGKFPLIMVLNQQTGDVYKYVVNNMADFSSSASSQIHLLDLAAK